MKNLLLTLLLISTASGTFAGNYFWKPTGGSTSSSTVGNWKTGSCTGSTATSLPSSSDTIIFSCSNTNCVIDANLTVAKIYLPSSYSGTVSVNSAQSFTFVSGNFKGGAFNANGCTLSCTHDITIDGTSFTCSSGTWTITGDFTYKSGTFTHNSGTVVFKKGSNTTTLIAGANTNGGTIVPLQFYKVEFAAPSSNTIFNLKNITMQANNETKISGSYSVFLNTTTSSTILALGDVTSSNSASTGGGSSTIFIQGTGNQTLTDNQGGGASGKLPNIYINKSSGTLSLSGTIGLGGSGTWEYHAGTVSEGTSTLICFYNNVLINSSGSTMKFYNLNFYGNGGRDSVIGIVTVGNTLSTSGSGDCVIKGDTLEALKDVLWNNTATTNFGNVTYKFTGTNSQTIGGSITPDFYKMSLNKTGGQVTLQTAVTVNNKLILKNGTIVTDTTHLLTLKNGVTVSGGSSISFVSGPLKKIGNSSFVFPVGKGSSYKPIAITAPSSTSDAFRAEYFGNQQTLGNNKDSLAYLSACEYWSLKRIIGTSNVKVTLYWDAATCDIYVLSTLRVARWNGSLWTNLGTVTSTGSTSSGNIQTNTAQGNFGYFLIAKHSTLYANAGLDKSTCGNDQVQLGGNPSRTGGISPFTYSWLPTEGLDTSYKANPITTLGMSQMYVLSVTDFDHITKSDTVLLTVHPGVLIFAGNSGPITQGANRILGGTPTVMSGTQPLSYTWSPASGLSSYSNANPVAFPSGSMMYHLTVTDTYNCTAHDSVYVGVIPISLGQATSFGILATDSIISDANQYVLGNVGSNSFVSSTISADTIKLNNTSVTNALTDLSTGILQINSMTASSLLTCSGAILSSGIYRIDHKDTLKENLTLFGDSKSYFILDFDDSLLVSSHAKIILDGVEPKQVFINVGKSIIAQDSVTISGTFLIAENGIFKSVFCPAQFLALGKIHFKSVGEITNAQQMQNVIFASLESHATLSESIYNNSNYDYFGINLQDITSNSDEGIGSGQFVEKIPILNPGTQRYPSGGISNEWDWYRGWWVNEHYADNPGEIFYSQAPPDKLTDLLNLYCATNASPVFDLDVINSSPNYLLQQYVANQPDDEYAITGLMYAKGLGIPVKYIELGNELYSANDEINTKLPSAQDYGSLCSDWITDLKTNFPNCKIAVVGALDRGMDLRRNTWNNSLFYPSGSYPGLVADAATFHVYPDGNFPISDGSRPDVNLMPGFFCDLRNTIECFKKDVAQIPMSTPDIWVTEFNLNNSSVQIHGSWAHGLYVAGLALMFLEEPRVQMVHIFNSMDDAGKGSFFSQFGPGGAHNETVPGKGFDFGSGTVSPKYQPGWNPLEMTCVGNTLRLINDAAKNFVSSSKIDFSGAPTLDQDCSDMQVVYGRSFVMGNGDQHIVIINFSGEKQTVNLGEVFLGITKVYYEELEGFPPTSGNLLDPSYSDPYLNDQYTNPMVWLGGNPIPGATNCSGCGYYYPETSNLNGVYQFYNPTNNIDLPAYSITYFYSVSGSLSISGPTMVCSNQPVALSVSGGTPPYVWNGSGNATVNLEGANATMNTGGPYCHSSSSHVHNQYLFTATELKKAGLSGGPISSISWKVTSLGSGVMNNYTIKLANTTIGSLSTSFDYNETFYQVYSTNYTAVSGINTHNFSTTFTWDGTSNIIVDLCYDPPANTSTVEADNTQNVCITKSNPNACTLTSGNQQSNRPTTIFGGIVSKQGAVVVFNPQVNSTFKVNDGAANSAQISVTVNSIPSVWVTTSSSPCQFDKALNANLSNSTSYSWFPIDGTVSGNTYHVTPTVIKAYEITAQNSNCTNAAAYLDTKFDPEYRFSNLSSAYLISDNSCTITPTIESGDGSPISGTVNPSSLDFSTYNNGTILTVNATGTDENYCSFNFSQNVEMKNPIIFPSQTAICYYNPGQGNKISFQTRIIYPVDNKRYEYLWTWDGGMYPSDGSHTTDVTFSGSPLATTDYTLHVFDDNMPCVENSKTHLVVTVNKDASACPCISNKYTFTDITSSDLIEQFSGKKTCYRCLSGLPDITIDGTFTINTDLTLTGAGVACSGTDQSKIKFGPDAKVVFDGPHTLTFDNYHLQACGTNLWTGIEISDPNAKLILKNSTLVEDAKFAVHSINGGQFEIGDLDIGVTIPVTFNRNYEDIEVENYTGPDPFPGYVRGTNFTCWDYCSQPSFSPLLLDIDGVIMTNHTQACIYLKNVKNFQLGDGNYTQNKFMGSNAYIDFGLLADNSPAESSIKVFNNNFSGWGLSLSSYAIKIIGPASGNPAILAIGDQGNQMNYFGTTSNHDGNGIFLNQNAVSTILYNDFTNVDYPIIIDGVSTSGGDAADITVSHNSINNATNCIEAIQITNNYNDNISVLNNSISVATGNAITLNQNSNIAPAISNNILSGYAAKGIVISNNSIASSGPLNIFANSLTANSGNASNDLEFSNNSMSTLNIGDGTVTNKNTINGGGEGFYLYGNNITTANLNDNSVSNTSSNSIYLEHNTIPSLYIKNNSVSNCGASGIEVYNSLGSSSTYHIETNNINTSSKGIYFTTDPGTSLTIQDNTMQGTISQEAVVVKSNTIPTITIGAQSHPNNISDGTDGIRCESNTCTTLNANYNIISGTSASSVTFVGNLNTSGVNATFSASNNSLNSIYDGISISTNSGQVGHNITLNIGGNTITDYSDLGITLSGNTFVNPTINSSNNLSKNLSNGGITGISVATNNGLLNINGNSVNGFSSNGIYLTGNTGQVTVGLSSYHNTITGGAKGIYAYSSNNSNGYLLVQYNDITGFSSTGISAQSNSIVYSGYGPTLAIDNNQVTGGSGASYGISTQSNTNNGSTIEINSNTITSISNTGILSDGNTAYESVDIKLNTLTNSGAATDINVSDADQDGVTISGNKCEMNNTTSTGIYLGNNDATNYASVITVGPNNILMGGKYAIHANGNSSTTIDIENGSTDAIYGQNNASIYLDGNDDADISITDNSVSSTPVGLSAETNNSISLTLDNNTWAVTQDGVQFESTNDGSLEIDADDIQAGQTGVKFSQNTGGSLLVGTATIHDTPTGVEVSNDNGSICTVSSLTAENNLDIVVDAENNDGCDVDVSGNTFSASGTAIDETTNTDCSLTIGAVNVHNSFTGINLSSNNGCTISISDAIETSITNGVFLNNNTTTDVDINGCSIGSDSWGIYSFGSDGGSFDAEYNTVSVSSSYVGLYLFGDNLEDEIDLHDNEADNGEDGIFIGASSAPVLSIQNNTLNGNNSIGIGSLFNVSNDLSIEQNIITTATNAYSVGIFEGGNEDASISLNSIYSNGETGIELLDENSCSLENNDITMPQTNAGGVTRYGISLLSTSDCSVQNNTVNDSYNCGTGGSNCTYITSEIGFLGSMSTNTLLCSNRFNAVHTGMKFLDDCTASNYASNIRNSNLGWMNEGLTLASDLNYTGSVISDQNLVDSHPAGNCWYGDGNANSIANETYNYGADPPPTFHVYDADCELPVHNSHLGYLTPVQIATTVNSSISCNQELNENFDYAFWEGVVENLFFSGVNKEELNFNLKTTLYKNEHHFTGTRTHSSVLTDFYDSTSSSSIGKFYRVDSMISLLTKDTLNGSLRLSIIGQAIATNDSIIPSAQYESNLKTTNDLYLNSIAIGDVPSEEDYLSLIDIANRCPYEDGKAVFIARAILSLVSDTLRWNDDSLCTVSERQSESSGDKGSEESILIYPNPTNSSITLQYTIKSGINCRYEIFNLIGNLVLSGKLDCNQHKLLLDLKGLNAGVFTLRILSDGSEHLRGKVIVVD